MQTFNNRIPNVMLFIRQWYSLFCILYSVFLNIFCIVAYIDRNMSLKKLQSIFNHIWEGWKVQKYEWEPFFHFSDDRSLIHSNKWHEIKHLQIIVLLYYFYSHSFYSKHKNQCNWLKNRHKNDESWYCKFCCYQNTENPANSA